jgi:cytochrome b6-f complex iron-sulfur subunit
VTATTVLAIAIPALVVAAGVLLFAAARRRDTGSATGSISHETTRRDRGPVTLDDDGAPLTGREVERAAALARRQFFNRSIVSLFAFSSLGLGGAMLAQLWPSGTGGFGGKIRVGTLEDINKAIADGDGFAYYPEARMWVTAYPSDALPKAEAVYSPPELVAMKAGIVTLWQKCPHLGCRVPSCETSQWFECPCHGSQYNRVGEKRGGPAPRGMDRFAATIDGDVVTVDTGTSGQIQGPPIGTNTTGQEAEGPHCVSGGSE